MDGWNFKPAKFQGSPGSPLQAWKFDPNISALMEKHQFHSIRAVLLDTTVGFQCFSLVERGKRVRYVQSLPAYLSNAVIGIGPKTAYRPTVSIWHMPVWSCSLVCVCVDLCNPSHVARSSCVRIVLAYPWHLLTHVTHAFTCDHGSFVSNTSIVHNPHDFLLPFQGVKVPYVVVAAAVVVVPGCWQHDNIARSSLHVLRKDVKQSKRTKKRHAKWPCMARKDHQHKFKMHG